MSEDKRRRAASGRRKKRARQKRLIGLAVLLAGLVIVLIALVIVVFKPGRDADGAAETPGEVDISSESGTAGDEDPDGPAQSGEAAENSGGESGAAQSGEAETSGSESGAASSGESTGEKKMLVLTDEDSRTGDLILVNYDHPYDFKANEAALDLTNIREGQSFYYQVGKLEFSVAGRILPALDSLVAACDEAMGTKLTGIESAYRSIEYQQGVWDEMTELYGEDYAKKYVAVPGYSEHHTGLAVDVGIFYEDGSEGSFSESENAVWMNDNACHYGFVRRFAEDKVDITHVSNEAWHFRYVGIPHAVYMTANNLCLEEYIAFLKSTEGAESPVTVEDGGHTWEIRYTTEREIEEPSMPYTISGTNDGGFVVTVQVG